MADQAQQVHDQAVAEGKLSYQDPSTGYEVFTSLGLKERGRCCGCGCRHCPFQHEKIPYAQRAARIANPAWLTKPMADATTALFWSGGKDSYLAYRELLKSGEQPVLITSFDYGTRVIAHQEIPIQHVVEQAGQLNAGLIGVPLAADTDYIQQSLRGIELLPVIKRLAFGDLHLEHIRQWREEAFQELVTDRGVELVFPVWQTPYESLLADLESSGVTCQISAVTHPALSTRIGETYDGDFVASLPADVDLFGENGEFHTRLTFQTS